MASPAIDGLGLEHDEKAIPAPEGGALAGDQKSSPYLAFIDDRGLGKRLTVKRIADMQTAQALGSTWAGGDFYVPHFASHGRSGLVPGPPDRHRRLFLERASILEPRLLTTLRSVTADDADELLTWATRWHLTDRWCLVLARDTARWYAAKSDAKEGWEFQGQGIFVGNFPFAIKPLRFKFYHDPTWRTRRDFKAYVLREVTRATDDYCDRTETAALAAGLKRAPRKRRVEHFDWLARYQVKGESFAFIARTASFKFEGGRQTVRKAITELAEYIELTLRPST